MSLLVSATIWALSVLIVLLNGGGAMCDYIASRLAAAQKFLSKRFGEGLSQ